MSTDLYYIVRHNLQQCEACINEKLQDSVVESSTRVLECGPMANVVATLPNIGGAIWSTPQSLADAQYWTAVQ